MKLFEMAKADNRTLSNFLCLHFSRILDIPVAAGKKADQDPVSVAEGKAGPRARPRKK